VLSLPRSQSELVRALAIRNQAVMVEVLVACDLVDPCLLECAYGADVLTSALLEDRLALSASGSEAPEAHVDQTILPLE